MNDELHSLEPEPRSDNPGYYASAEDASTQVTEEDFTVPEPTREVSTQVTEDDFIVPEPTREVSIQVTEEDFIVPEPTQEVSTQVTEEDFIVPEPTIKEASTQRTEEFIDDVPFQETKPQTSDKDLNAMSPCPDLPCERSNPEAGNSFVENKEIHTAPRPIALSLQERLRNESKIKPITRRFLLDKHSSVYKLKGIFKCGKCPKKFQSESLFKTHVKNHDDPKPYKCDRCGKAYAFECRLKQHYRVHTGEKPFECKECSYTTTRNLNLKNHLRRKHGK